MRMDKLTLKELCEELSISTATGRNWIKLNKLQPEYVHGKPMFEENYVNELKDKLQSGQSQALKSRRNKKYVSGQELYDGYISETSKNRETIKEIITKFKEYCGNDESMALMAYYAKQMSEERGVDYSVYNGLIADMTHNVCAEIRFARKYPWVTDYKLVYEDGEDILGLLYISCKHIGERKATGAYYTPSRVVKELSEAVWPGEGFCGYKRRKVMDPSCGTGNFLLQLPEYISLDEIYGMDIDEQSIGIARINLALKYRPKCSDALYKNIRCGDYLRDNTWTDFDYIIGNPPWGYDFSSAQKRELKKIYSCAKGKGVESYDLFVERSFDMLRPGGKLAFVLPESIVTVKSHSQIRELIRTKANLKAVTYLGDIFHRVQCPSVIVEMEKKYDDEKPYPDKAKSIEIKRNNRAYSVVTADRLDRSGFQLAMEDAEYKVMQKIYSSNVAYLSGQATFAMGIVTGDNSRYISEISKEDNEPIIIGKDVEKYYIQKPTKYIQYKPKQLQQVASDDIYRSAEKLVYRFIGDKLRFAYDDKGLLTLNSCNVLIPHIDGLAVKYVMAVLNSTIADFVYRKRFGSVKILRSHIEEIPIPVVSHSEQERIIEIVDRLEKISASSDYGLKEQFHSLYMSLDGIIVGLFGLNEEEYDIIRRQ